MKDTLFLTYSTKFLVILLTVNMKKSYPQKSENVRLNSNNYIENATSL